MFKKYFLSAIYIVVIILAGGWLFRFKLLKFYYRESWQASSPEAFLLKHEKTFMEDRLILSKYPIFGPSLGAKDAGPYLNPMIHWEIGEIHHKGSLVLPAFVHKEMNKDWVNKKPLFEKMGLDFTWMKDLHQYDYWNPEENSPAYLKNKKYVTYSFPIPTYKDLMTWSKLRLLYGRETGDLVSAFKDVRHLARLIWTNDYLVSSMVTIGMLRYEHEIHQGNWEIIPEEVLMRAKRHFYGLPNVVDARLNDQLFHKMVNTDVGICPMIVEGLMNYIAIRDLLSEELKEEYSRIGKLVLATQGKCRKTIVHKMWDDTSWPTIMADDQDAFPHMGESKLLGDKKTWGELKQEPDLKIIIGYLMSGLGTPNYLSSYEKTK